jgi:glutathione S-transferase
MHIFRNAHLKYACILQISPSGFFLGEGRFSLADLALGPWMQRVPVVLKTYRDFEIPNTPDFERINNWWATLRVHPSFSRVTVSPEALIKNYIGYANGTATSECSRSLKVGNNLAHDNKA